MATIEQVGEFKPKEEKISAYLERIQLFFTANSIADENKLPFYCRLLVQRLILCHKICQCQPNLKKGHFAELLTTLTSHYEPKSIVITRDEPNMLKPLPIIPSSTSHHYSYNILKSIPIIPILFFWFIISSAW